MTVKHAKRVGDGVGSVMLVAILVLLLLGVSRSEALPVSPPPTPAIGSPCSTSGTRGFPPVLCNNGSELDGELTLELVCVIFDEGDPDVDIPNRGTCQPRSLDRPPTPMQSRDNDTRQDNDISPPRILLTEIGSPMNVRFSGSFIELFNPLQQSIDLAEYGFIIGKISTSGDSITSDTKSSDNTMNTVLKYDGYTVTSRALKGTIEPMTAFILCTNKRSFNREHGIVPINNNNDENETSRRRCDYRIGDIANVIGNDIIVLTAEPGDDNTVDNERLRTASNSTKNPTNGVNDKNTPSSSSAIVDIFGGNVYLKPAMPLALPLPFSSMISEQQFWPPLVYGRAERVSFKPISSTHRTKNGMDLRNSNVDDNAAIFMFDAREWQICSLLNMKSQLIAIDNNPHPVIDVLRQRLGLSPPFESCPKRALVAPHDFDPGSWHWSSNSD